MWRSGLILISLSLASNALAAQDDPSWFRRGAEGWFWYNEEPPPPEEELPEEIPPPPAPPPVAESPPAPEPNEPAMLSTAWLKANLPHYLDQAIDHPTPENVAAYLYLQKYAMDKSFMFSEVVQQVTLGDGDLDQNAMRSLTTAAAFERDDLASSNRKRLLADVSQRAGFLFFIDRARESQTQANMLKAVKNEYGIEFVGIDINGDTSPFEGISDVRLDKGHVSKYNIKHFPAIVLVGVEGGHSIISQGPIGASAFEERTLFAAARSGIITESQFNSARRIEGIEQIKENAQIRPATGTGRPSSQDVLRLFRSPAVKGQLPGQLP